MHYLMKLSEILVIILQNSTVYSEKLFVAKSIIKNHNYYQITALSVHSFNSLFSSDYFSSKNLLVYCHYGSIFLIFLGQKLFYRKTFFCLYS